MTKSRYFEIKCKIVANKPSMKGTAKINAREILFDKTLENQNLNNITYNFVPKNAIPLHFDKSFA